MNKSFKKLFVACAAVTAMTAVTAISANADGLTAEAVKDGSGNYSTVSVGLATGSSVSGETTIVLLKGDYTKGDKTTVAESDILYINQDTAENAKKTGGFLSANGVLPQENLTEGSTYTVKVADASGTSILDKVFTVGASTGGDVEYGNVNGDHKANGDPIINSADATLILKYAAELVSFDATQIAAANVYQDYKLNGDPIINSADATLVLKYAAELVTELPVVPEK